MMDFIQLTMSSESSSSSWYPNAADMSGSTIQTPALYKAKVIEKQLARLSVPPHKIWESGEIKYTSNNFWSPKVNKEKKEKCRRQIVVGVEVRDLPSGHFLAGEQGLFALEKFSQFDIVGEYTGRVVDDDISGHYVAALEDKAHEDSLGLDAGNCGNEMRFINSYLNVDFAPNVTMRTAYMNTYPRILIVATRDILPGEEFLLDYGEAYNQAFLIPKDKTPANNISAGVMEGELPGGLVEEDEREGGLNELSVLASGIDSLSCVSVENLSTNQ